MTTLEKLLQLEEQIVLAKEDFRSELKDAGYVIETYTSVPRVTIAIHPEHYEAINQLKGECDEWFRIRLLEWAEYQLRGAYFVLRGQL